MLTARISWKATLGFTRLLSYTERASDVASGRPVLPPRYMMRRSTIAARAKRASGRSGEANRG